VACIDENVSLFVDLHLAYDESDEIFIKWCSANGLLTADLPDLEDLVIRFVTRSFTTDLPDFKDLVTSFVTRSFESR
jgi:tRNA(His) 5'-end guanylyltransferase